MSETAATALVIEYENALSKMMDENESLQAQVANLNGQVSTLIDWVMGDVDALTALQEIYVNCDDPATRIKAAAAAIGYERPKLAASANLVVVDFRERVRQARLKATAKLIEHVEPPKV
jgi:hypothetical protein